MPNKIEGAIKKMLSKNEKALGKAKKKKVLVAENVAAMKDSSLTEEQLIEGEMKRHQAFARKKPGFTKATSDTTGSDEDAVTRMAAHKKRIQKAFYGGKKKKK